MILKKFRLFWKLIYAYPLHFIAAYIAALLCNFLLTLQPGFIRVFINEASRGVDKSHLLFIASFMSLALLLAFLFDTLQMTISLEFELKVEKSLRTLYQKYCQFHSQRQIGLTIQKGIYALTNLTVETSLDLLLVFSNLIMVISFMLLEDKLLGSIVLIFLSLGIFISLKLTSPLSRIAHVKEVVKNRMIKQFSESSEKHDRSIRTLQMFEHKRFFLETVFVFCSFSIFRLIPSFILVAIAISMEKNLGSIASLFLYFNLLHKPYLKLIQLIKNNQLSYSQSGLFRKGIEAALYYEHHIRQFPSGVFLIPTNEPTGFPLEEGIKEKSYIYTCKEMTNLSDKTLLELKTLASKKPVLIYSKNKQLLKYAHFSFEAANQSIKTIPTYLMEQKLV